VAHPLIGTRLAHYDLLGPLGSGAMSDVYLARDTRLDKQVAVKVINEALLDRPDLVDRFEREAMAAARLEHPNVAAVFFSGVHDDKPFYAMELVRGWSVSDLIESRVAFKWEQCLSLFAQACAGLEAAGAAGVVHRDIKPGNLMVTGDGTVKLVDFGLAKFGEERLLRGNAMLGTPFYIAPEMVRGRAADHLSDIYSLGVTMFHFIAGHPPYDAETPYAVMTQHLTEPIPSLLELDESVPEGLARLVFWMMHKQPLGRPQTFRAVERDLKTLADGLTPDELAARRAWCNVDNLNTSDEDGGRCQLCKHPRGVRKRPETFHVDLVGWRDSSARGAVAQYIADAIGQDAEDVVDLIDPLPFRAAFRTPRDRAKGMHRAFHDLGGIVQLVPADEEEERKVRLDELPFRARWPRARVQESRTTLPPVRPPPSGGSATPWKAATAVLSVAVVVLLVLLMDEPRVVYLDAPPPPTPAVGASPVTLQAPPAASPTSAPTPHDAPSPAPVDEQAPPPIEPGDSAAEPDAVADASGVGPPASPWIDLDPGGADPATVGRALGALEVAAARVADQLAGSGERRDVRLTDAPFASWPQATTSPTIALPVGGLADVSDADLKRATHHLLARARVAAMGRDVPEWLVAGLAAYLADGPVPEALWSTMVAAGLPTQATPREGDGDAVIRSLGGFVSFVVEARGLDRLQRAITLTADGHPLDDASLRSLGTTLADLEQEWVAVAGGVD